MEHIIVERFKKILDWYNTEFKQDPLYLAMSNTVEDSPWHREPNVGIHTDLVVQEYVTRCVQHGMVDAYSCGNGLFAAIFHDTGKPMSRIEKFKPERGTYYAYHGHEQASARLFENYAVCHRDLFSAKDIYSIGWMIENHLPWDMVNAEKRKQLALTAKHVNEHVYTRVLLADTYGRLAEDADKKRKESEAWVSTFLTLVQNTPNDKVPSNDAPTLWMPIASSGSGKSTYLHSLRLTYPDIGVFSLDDLRHEFYDANDYRIAYQMSVEDEFFSNKVHARYNDIIKEKKDIYIDNINVSAKKRKWYLDIARKHGYKLIAVLMPVSLDTVIARQTSRTDKTVPAQAVRQHYFSLQLPQYGEFDEIVISDHNIVG